MSDFTQLVARLNAISMDQEPLKTVLGTDLYNKVDESTLKIDANPDKTAMKGLLSIMGDIPQEQEAVVESEEVTEEDPAEALSGRFKEFLQKEANTSPIADIQAVTEEQSNDYIRTDKMFTRMLDGINKMETMMPMLANMMEKTGASGMSITKGIDEVAEHLSQAYEALTVIHNDTLGKEMGESDEIK